MWTAKKVHVIDKIFINFVTDLIHPHFISNFSDISRREFFMLLPFVIGILWIGIYPEPFLETIHCSVSNLLYQGS